MSQKPSGHPGASSAAAAGRAFAGLFRAIKLARPDRPIHPDGLGLEGELTRTGTDGGPSGLDWLDSRGVDQVRARFSRSIGLPQRLPDVLGLALRVTTKAEPPTGGAVAGGAVAAGNGASADVSGTESVPAGGIADVLFASTGWQVPARFLLVPKLAADTATLTTLMPYRGRRGPVLLGLRTESLPAGSLAARSVAEGPVAEASATPGSAAAGEWVLSLHWATPTGPWHQCGVLRLRAAPEPADTPLRFNPLENQPPGAQTYAWARRLRERSYRAAQRPAPAAVVRPPGSVPSATAGHETATAPKPPIGRNSMSTVSQQFKSPAEHVWKVIADGWLYSGWVVGASRIRDVDDHWPSVGAQLHHSVGAWPLVINDSTRVTAVEPGRSLELVARGWPVGEAKVILRLEDRDEGCQVTIMEDAIRGPGKLVPKFLRDPMIDVRNRETLKRLELMAAGGAGR